MSSQAKAEQYAAKVCLRIEGENLALPPFFVVEFSLTLLIRADLTEVDVKVKLRNNYLEGILPQILPLSVDLQPPGYNVQGGIKGCGARCPRHSFRVQPWRGSETCCSTNANDSPLAALCSRQELDDLVV